MILRLTKLVRLDFRSISTRRTNPVGIQMISSSLHEQVFGSKGEPIYSKENIEKARKHLRTFELGEKESEIIEQIDFRLPKLESRDLNEHFERIARKQSSPYVELIENLLKSVVPRKPNVWNYEKGWTKCVEKKIDKKFTFDLTKIFERRSNFGFGRISGRTNSRFRR